MRARCLLFAIFFCAFHCHILAQVITSLTPNSSPPGQTIDVAIRGVNTHFKNGTSVADFGAGIIVQKFVAANTITGTATIQVTSGAALGFRNVTVTTGSEVDEMNNSFEVFSATGMFRATIELLPMESVSLKDIDLTQPSKTPVLFFANLYNDNTTRQVNIAVSITGSSQGYIGNTTLKNQMLAPNSYTRYTNRDFTAVNTNGAAGNSFLTTVEQTGVFPPDNYVYQITVTDINGNVLATASSTMVITNPLTNPELITPGASFTDNVATVYNPLPLFQWFGQNNKYNFAIYEWMPGQTQEEVVRNVPVYHQEGISGNSFLYPNYAEKLIDGKTYAWQILGVVVTPSGNQTLPSEVFRFNYVDMASAGNAGTKIVSRITLSPQEITLVPGKQYQFTATFYAQDGSVMTNVSPVWQVTPNYGAITPSGLYTAGQAGNTLAVIVSAGTATEFATVNVFAPVGSYNAFDGFVKKLFGLQ